MVMPPGEVGAYLVHFTGSADHNVRLRGVARDRAGAYPSRASLRIGEDGSPLDRRGRASCGLRHRGRGLRLPRTCPTSSPSCARTVARSRRRSRAACRPSSRSGDLQGDLHTPLRLVRRPPVDRGDGRGRPAPRPRIPGPDRPLASPGHRARADPRSRRGSSGAIIADLNAAVRARGGGRPAPPEATPEGFRLLHGCELEIRADGQLDYPDELLAHVRPRRRLAPRRPPPDPGRADPALLNAIAEPARRRHRPPGGPDDRHPRRPRPRLGGGLRARRPDRHGARDERLAAPARPVGRTGAPRALAAGLPPVDRLGRPPHARVRAPRLGRLAGAAGVGRAGRRAQHPLPRRPPGLAGAAEAAPPGAAGGAGGGPAARVPSRG